MSNIVKYSNEAIKGMVLSIIKSMVADKYHPDYVVGITRSGAIPATMLSNFFDVPLYSLNVSFGKFAENEVNAWMPEDAFGYMDSEQQAIYKSRWDITKRKNILIVDSINNTGNTFEWIKQDWESSCLPDETAAWQSIWHHNVKFAVLINDEFSTFKLVDYAALHTCSLDIDNKIKFPWENWWE